MLSVVGLHLSWAVQLGKVEHLAPTSRRLFCESNKFALVGLLELLCPFQEQKAANNYYCIPSELFASLDKHSTK